MIPPRDLRALLDETFAIYGRHFWRLTGLVAVVQAPISLVSLALLEVLGMGTVTSIVVFLLGLSGTTFVYGAGVFAVGQQYVTGGIGVRSCYTRAWWRIASLVVFTIAIAGILLSYLAALSLSSHPLLAWLVALLMIPATAYAIYWSMAIQAVIVEGYKPVGSVRRSFALVRGSWWRIFRITLVVGLVALGLGIVATIPFAVASAIVGADPASGLFNAIQSLGSLVVGIIVPPVLFVAGTLVYYDLRVRKEEYDFTALSHELGIVPV